MILQVESLSKNFGGLRAVADVSMAVRERTIHSILGPNGAGKTTLFNLITGAFSPTSGTVRLFNEDITGATPNVLVGKGLVRTFQRTSIFPSLTAVQNLAIAIRSRKGMNMAIAESRNVANEVTAEAHRILDIVGIREHKDTPSRNLSHGSQHALDIAIGFALAPKVLLMDEPLAGMSRGDRERIADVILALRDDHDLTIVIVEHDIGMVMRVSDTITVLQNGSVIAEGPPCEIKGNPDVKKAYLRGEFSA